MRVLAPLLLLSTVSCFATDEVWDVDDGLSLLQARAQSVLAEHGPRTFVPSSDKSLRMVGRYDTVQLMGSSYVRFDAAGFEIQFRVHGAKEIRIGLEQRITGPGGWYFDRTRREDQWDDGCHVDKSKALVLQQMNHSVMEGVGAGMEPQGSQPHHFLVYIDGYPVLKPWRGSKCKVCTFDTAEAKNGKVDEYLVAIGLNPATTHDIRIVKTSEPDFSSVDGPVPNWLAFRGLILDKGHVLPPQQPRRTRKIEFLGDSLMTGYCNVCKGDLCTEGFFKNSHMKGNPTDIFRWGSFALAWPYLLCESLNAECHATVLAGMGMRCNTHPPGHTDCSKDVTLPDYWQRTFASDNISTWDFNSWVPDVLMVQVSNNDHVFDDPDTLVPVTLAAYKEFFNTAKSRYPNTHIVIVCGPLPTHENSDFLCPKFEQLAKAENLEFMLVMDDNLPQAKEDSIRDHRFRECCGHPSEEYHKFINDKAVDLVGEITGWR